LVLILMFGLSTSAFAQGSITGTVNNSDMSVPADGLVSFVGFLDDTDEEIRIETCVGAGYQSGNWFDDFQNYQTEAAGNPYDYLFYNATNMEGFQLSGAIPSGSFQVENIMLAPVPWSAAPVGLGGVSVSPSTVILDWHGVAGLTYHVYRRTAPSTGSLFRIDDPSGLLTNPGVPDSFFVDVTVDGVSTYDYLIIAEDPSGNLSPHSTVFTINSGIISPPVVASIAPNTGTSNGGTPVDVLGSGFDPAGATVMFGATGVPATFITPFHLTATSPLGTMGASVDISAVNTASGLGSNILTGGFTYSPNATPVLASIGVQQTTEGIPLIFAVSASDSDGDTPILTTSVLPGSAVFVDSANGMGSFDWTPLYTEDGIYTVTFFATDAIDPLAVDSEIVTITVLESGNHAPVMVAVNDTSVAENAVLNLTIAASDVDGEIPSLSVANPPTNHTFTDQLDGTADFSFTPDFTQAGVYDVIFKAVDAALDVDSIIVQITVTDVNQLPELATIGSQGGTEDIYFSFLVSATDLDGTTPSLTTTTLPGTAIFTDSLNGNGLFEWTPLFTDAGIHTVTFYAADADYPLEVDSEVVTITIADAGNQAPELDSIGVQFVAEGDSLGLVITASDPDATIPIITAENLPLNATFTDLLDGTASFDFNPDFTQAGPYTVTFIASDGILADSEFVDITVTDGGNIAPVISAISDTTIDEGGTLVLAVTASDPDGGAVFPALSISTTLDNYDFTDDGNGNGTLTYTPDFYDAGVDSVTLFATDYGAPQQTSSVTIAITTVDINQVPVIDSIGPFGVQLGDSLVFSVTATDPTDPDTLHRVFLSAIGLPANSDFTDNGDGTGTFGFLPDVSQVGLVSVSFLAVDQGVPQLSSTLDVDINVVTVNIPPVIDSIGPQIITEGDQLTINITASDPDGPAPVIDTANAPEYSTFIDYGDGTADYIFAPDYLGGTRLTSVKITAYDGIALVSELVLIQINDAGNQVPVFEVAQVIPVLIEGDTLNLQVTAYDPDGSEVFMFADSATMPVNGSFVDSGGGVGAITFMPDYSQSGSHDFTIITYDGPVDDPATLSVTSIVNINVTDAGNQIPVLDSIGSFAIDEGEPLTFSVTAADADGTMPHLTTSVLPANAGFTDNLDGTGDFNFTPDMTQAGTHFITFYAADDSLGIDSEVVEIVVADVNQLPFVFTSGSATVNEGETLLYEVESFDADGTYPYLDCFLSGQDSLGTNMSFVDNRDGTGVLTFTPDYTQGGPPSNPATYFVVFRATDESYPEVSQTSPTVTIDVVNMNQPPELVFPDGAGPFTANEGDTVSFQVVVLDPDGTSPASLTALNMPATNATFTVLTASGYFDFYPDFTQSGSYLIRFIAVDPEAAADTQDVQIDIIEVGNQSPRFSHRPPDTVQIPLGQEYSIPVESFDPDLDSISLVAYPVIEGASWVDYGDGTGLYTIEADSIHLESVVEITFIATDHPSLATDSLITHSIVVSFLRGDVDNSTTYSLNDVDWLVGYLFREGPPPEVEISADVDADGLVNGADISYLIYFLYFHGSAPPPP